MEQDTIYRAGGSGGGGQVMNDALLRALFLSRTA